MRTNITLALLFCAFFSTNTFAQAPNIVVIIADDMGWSQVSTGLTNFNNQSDFYETPVLATLASEGIAFPNGYVNGANCAPTRAAILSGQYAARPHNNIFNVYNLNRGNAGSLLVGPDMGIASNGNVDEIPASAITIAETLKTVGYSTAHLGKFHMGENSWQAPVSNNNAYQQGFDYNYGGGTKGGPGAYHASGSGTNWTFHANIGPELDEDPISGVKYALPYTAAESAALAVGGYDLEGEEKHVTDAMTDAAIYFMESEKNNPFFMHFSNFAVHGPTGNVHARPDLLAKYQAKDISSPSSMGHNDLGLAAILEGMDQSIGRLIDYLKVTDDPRNPGFKLSENTLVFFISDNGGAKNTQENGPLKGMKGEYYEGGIRSVSLAWSEAPWLANKGTVDTTPIIGFDLYPTFAEMAGASLPGGGYDIDGTSLWSLLSSGTAPSRDALYWHFPGYLIDSKRDQRPVTVVRKGDYKLIHNYETASYELYNLSTDISESTNLLSGSPDQATVDLANDMVTDMRNHLITTSAPLPTYRSDGTTVPLPDFITLSANSTNGCQPIAGYEAFWDFDTASSANDASGNGHDPVATSGTLTYDTTDSMEGDQSAVFDGSTEITYDDGTFLNSSATAKTVMTWIKPTALSGTQVIFEEGGTGNGFGVQLNGTNLEVAMTSNSEPDISISTAYPNDGDWHHVAVVFDGTSTSLDVYIDGTLATSSSSALSLLDSHSSPGGIGGVIGGGDAFGNGSNGSFFTGKMDAFAIYDSALSLAQIEESACSNTLDIGEHEIGFARVYPNPFNDKISVQFNQMNQNISVQLFDIMGKAILAETYSNKNYIELPLEQLSQGVYLLKINSDNKIVTKKVIRQ